MDRVIDVLHEDDFYVAFNKPAGMLVIPAPDQHKGTLTDIVNKQYFLRREAQETQTPRLYPCHRLDRDTSGVILFAKGKKNQQWMMTQFKKRSVEKKYIAFVHGRLPYPQGEISGAIKDVHQQRFSRKVPPRLAITRYRVIEKRDGFSVLEVYPITGRTHQIRIHFSQEGHPVLGERQYAFGKDFELKFRRTALHAKTLRWKHPLTHKVIEATAPLAKDMKEFLAP